MYFGAHMSTSGGLERALERGLETGCEVVQIFTRSQLRWSVKRLGEREVERFLELAPRFRSVFAHASYLINLATPDPRLHRRSVAALTRELERCARLRLDAVVIHPGSHRGSGEAAGIRRVADAIRAARGRGGSAGVRILLETTAGGGSALGHRFQHLRDIMDRLGQGSEGVGVCLDTAHVFAAGYDIRRRTAYERTMAELDRVVGLQRVRVIHANDSTAPLGSGVDRHEHIGRGCIGRSGFRLLVTDRRLRDRPCCLETPKKEGMREDVRNLRVLRELAGGGAGRRARGG